MNKFFLFIACLFLPFISHSQESQAVFPDDFLGIYKGKLHISSIQSDKQEIPMEFRLGKTDAANHYEYVLSSIFQVGNTLLVSRMEFSDQKLHFEILTTRVDQKMETGNETGFEVYGYPLSGRQKAVLYQQDAIGEIKE